MDAFGSISQFPVRHYLAATAIRSKGLDQLVNDPGAALRRLGELAVNERVRAADRADKTPAISVAADRSIGARLMRQSLDELRGEAGPQTKAEAGTETGGEAPIDVSPEATSEATVAKMRVVIAAARIEGGDTDARIGAGMDAKTPSVENFLAVEGQDSPYNILGLIDRAV